MIRNIKFKDVIDSRMVLKRFLKKELPFSVAKKIQLFFKDSDIIEKNFREAELMIIKEYSELDENGEPKAYENANKELYYKIKTENAEKYAEEINKLLDKNIRYNLDEDIYFEDEDFTSLSCTPDELRIIDWMVI